MPDPFLPPRPLPAPRPLPPLRPWQAAALEAWEARTGPNFLAVATPGAGKTVFALTAASGALFTSRARRVVVVVPTQHLKTQWTQAAERFSIHLDPEWAAGYGTLPSDVHGIAVTYQQVAANPEALRPLVRQALVVLDEIHHAGSSRAWGDSVHIAFEHAPARLCLSGTPFRSDQSRIPFVTYEQDLADADYEYGYGEALADQRVVRPVYFPRIGGRMEWTAPDGLSQSATFDDPLSRELANQRLRTALDVGGEWLPAVLDQAHAQLLHLRARDPLAAGLVIAIDQDHARQIAQRMAQRFGIRAVVATSDDPAASRRIAEFAAGVDPWLVAVRMVSEGVDIPRLRVGVYATNTVTELFFRQAVGRLVRFSGRLLQQAAYMFIPDDLRLRTFSSNIAEQRRHNLRKDKPTDPLGDETSVDPDPRRSGREADAEEQLSLFAAISAVPLDPQGQPLAGARVWVEEAAHPEDETAIPDLAPLVGAVGADAGAGALELGPPLPPLDPPLPLAPAPAPGPTGPSPLARRRELRERNSAFVRELVHATGKGHAEINGLLNRKVGIKRITEASVRQLERRLELARQWLRR